MADGDRLPPDRALLISLAVSVVFSGLMGLANAWRADRLSALLSPTPAEVARAMDATALAGVAAVGKALVVAVTAVLLLSWLTRAYRHFDRLGAPMAYSPRQTVAAWLVPLANLVWPYRVLAELIEAAADTRDADDTALKRLARWWWAFMLAGFAGLPALAAVEFALIAEPGAPALPLIVSRALAYMGAALFLGGLILEYLLIRLMALLDRPPVHRPAPDARQRYTANRPASVS